MSLLAAVLEQTLLFFPLVAGISLSYKILHVTDITVDGSFVLGAAVYAKALTLGLGVPCGFILALIFGALAGISVAVIQSYLRIDSLVAGILLLFMLQSINFMVMGRPNISVTNMPYLLYLIVGYAVLVFVLLATLLQSNYGLRLRAVGISPKIFQEQLGGSVFNYRLFGLAVSNACAASAGALVAQASGFADLNMGFGMAIVGIGSVVIGGNIYKKLFYEKNFNSIGILGAGVLGSLAYFTVMHILLLVGINPIYLKLFLGLVLIFCLKGKFL